MKPQPPECDACKQPLDMLKHGWKFHGSLKFGAIYNHYPKCPSNESNDEQPK